MENKMEIEIIDNISDNKFVGYKLYNEKTNEIIEILPRHLTIKMFAEENNFEYKQLSSLLNRTCNRVGGWILYDRKEEFEKVREQIRLEDEKWKILQISLNDGKIIKSWDSNWTAAKINNFSHNRIRLVCQGKPGVKKSNGFFWCYEHVEKQKEFNVFPKDWIGRNKVERVLRDACVILDSNFNIVKEFESLEAARIALGGSNTIKNAIRECKPYLTNFLLCKKDYHEENYDEIKMEYDSMKFECKICGVKSISKSTLSGHLQFSHKEISQRDYYVKYELNGIEPTCKISGCSNTPRYCSTGIFLEYCKEHSKIAMSEGGKRGGRPKKIK
jgi:hypothetical protein